MPLFCRILLIDNSIELRCTSCAARDQGANISVKMTGNSFVITIVIIGGSGRERFGAMKK